MKLMWALLALIGISFGLAFAFLPSEPNVIQETLKETVGVSDQLTYQVITNGK